MPTGFLRCRAVILRRMARRETALTPQLLQTLYGIQAILAEVPTDRGTVRSLIVTEDME